jgi:hypothetical protein
LVGLSVNSLRFTWDGGVLSLSDSYAVTGNALTLGGGGISSNVFGFTFDQIDLDLTLAAAQSFVAGSVPGFGTQLVLGAR